MVGGGALLRSGRMPASRRGGRGGSVATSRQKEGSGTKEGGAPSSAVEEDGGAPSWCWHGREGKCTIIPCGEEGGAMASKREGRNDRGGWGDSRDGGADRSGLGGGVHARFIGAEWWVVLGCWVEWVMG